MASMRDIKRRKESVQSTGQITKAMKLVSSVKLQKAKVGAEVSKPYFDTMYNTVAGMIAKSGQMSHPYLQKSQSEKKAVILISSNRGLAGGYNANVVKLVTKDERFSKENTIIYAVGTKGRDSVDRLGYEIAGDYSEAMNEPVYSDATGIGKEVLSKFAQGEIGEIYLAYTIFKNTIVQIPTMTKLLPIDAEDIASESEDVSEDPVDRITLMNYEPEPEEALDAIVPKYINSLIYGGLVESHASENGARMQAMDSATNNAEEMISDLSLKYNRARQASITQELTEIIAGASAIS
ncbi:MAG: ATP synthase F1 subunit gamma [Lachnospiraceae bacterium]|nr:ATP synthase F1 subunit gamma [Lachnospiraceae bacterium]RKI25592.1 ATP synthase F1 subunit gamma [bacterium D16-36]RKI68019.1 ATP synthase F1 subunit gamma [bacterium 1xD8-6]